MVAMSTKIRSIKILHGRPLDCFISLLFPLVFVRWCCYGQQVFNTNHIWIDSLKLPVSKRKFFTHFVTLDATVFGQFFEIYFFFRLEMLHFAEIQKARKENPKCNEMNGNTKSFACSFVTENFNEINMSLSRYYNITCFPSYSIHFTRHIWINSYKCLLKLL